MHSPENQNKDPPLQGRLKLKRSMSLGDLNLINKPQTDTTNLPNTKEFCQSQENKVSRHSSTDLHYSFHVLKTDFKEEIISDDEDYSMPLFNYSQEDEVILSYDSDEEEEDINKSLGTNSEFEESKNVGQISQFGYVKLEEDDTQPCSDFEETQEDQQQNESLDKNILIEKTFTSLQSNVKQEVPILSTSPKFMKNKLDNLTKSSFENSPILAKKIKQEDKSDSEDDSEDLFQDEMDSQLTQLYTQTERTRLHSNKSDKVNEKRDPPGFAEHKSADFVKMIKNPHTKMSSDEDDGLNECLANNGDQDDKKDLKTDDAFLCSTQIDSHADDEIIKRNTTLKGRSKIESINPHMKNEENKSIQKRRKKTSLFYESIESDDNLFWFATQVDSNHNKGKPLVPPNNNEPFILSESDEDNDSDGVYMMATQIDMELENLSHRQSQSRNTFKLPILPQIRASKDTNEEHSDSDESMFSVATQLDILDKDEDEQVYMDQTQVDDFLDESLKHKSGKTRTFQASSQNVKKRKLKHKKYSRFKYLNDLHERNTSGSDSDDSVFSLATQIDDDSLFMAATQVDPEPLKNLKVPLSFKNSKTLSQTSQSLLKLDYDYDSDDSVYSVATQIDAESSSSYLKSSKIAVKNLKSQKKIRLNPVYTVDEDCDSDSSMYSVATQIDIPNDKKKCDQKEEEDIAYSLATQVDPDVSAKKTKSLFLKDDVFKVPFFPKKKTKGVHSSPKDSKIVTSNYKQSKETVTNCESVNNKPYNNFLLGIAEGEVEEEIVVISPGKDEINNSEETEKKFGKFLLDLSDVPLQEQPNYVTQTCPVEPLRLKTKKEMREAFKTQSIKDTSNKMPSPEKKYPQKMSPKVSLLKDSWLSKCKKTVQKKKMKEETAISKNIHEARNQLEERYFLSHLDNSRVGWNKASHIHYGSSSTITDVQLPDEDEIRKKRLPLTEGPQRRRPLPEIPTEHLPEGKQPDMSVPTVNTPVTTMEQKKSFIQTLPMCTSINPRTSLGVVSTQFYRSSHLDRFKIPKLPSDSMSQIKLDESQSSTEKTSKHPTEFVAKQFQLKQKIADNKVMNRSLNDVSTNTGYNTKQQPIKQIFSNCVLNKQNSYPSRTTQTICLPSRNQYLQDRRNFSDNTKDKIFKHLLKWNPKWLTEQKNIKMIPPIVKIDQLFPLLNTYTTLEDYQSIFMPLLLLEIWESISKDFSENSSKNREWRVAFSNVQILNTSFMDYIVYGVISVQDYSNKKQMMEGDLVKMNLQVKNPQNTKTESIQQNLPYPVMGTVEAFKFFDPQFHNEILERFPQLASLPEVRSKFKVYRAIVKTHYRKLIHAFTDLMSLELISTLIPHLRQFQALMAFSSNPLLPHILNPGKGEAAESGVDIPSKKKYNSSQLKAIAAAACIVRKESNQPSYCLIQGPPGTGKSHTIIGIINKTKEINKNCKILLCAPSNGAIDELTRRLIKERHVAHAESREPLKVVRIGNPDNIHDDVLSYSLSELIKSNARAGIQKCESVCPEVKRICANEKHIILKLKDPALKEKNIVAEEQKRKLVKDLRNLQEKKKFLTRQFKLAQSVTEVPTLSYKKEAELRQTILLKANVICSTLNTCGNSLYLNDLSSQPFDCIIIDEASQCTELDCLIPLQYNCCKLILLGDTQQLAPTVLSQRAVELNYGQSLFERLCNYFKDLENRILNPVIMLNYQYRMHPEICKFSSRYIYENKLLSDLNLELRPFPVNIVPYLLFNIQKGHQIRSSVTGSLSNQQEAEFTVCLCDYLLGLNGTISSLAIGIIAPYRMQKNLLQDLLHQRKIYKIEVTTVDGFQGREKDIIIMSCVRAQGSYGKIGFLSNRKRLNVALTRAKFALYIVGHLQSLEEADEDWKSLIEDAYQRKLVVPVHSEGSAKKAIQNCLKS